MADQAEKKCKVCKKDVSGAHQCQECKEFVHFICGKGVGEEAYGQYVVCDLCQIRINDSDSTTSNKSDESAALSDEKRETVEISDDEGNKGQIDEAVEIPEKLWKIFPAGCYLVEILKFTGFTDVKSVLQLRKNEKLKEMFDCAIDLIELVPDKKKMFGPFEKIPGKVQILPGLQYRFSSFLNECEKLSSNIVPSPDVSNQIPTKAKALKQKTVQPTPSSSPPEKKKPVVETIKMVNSRLKKWMEKHGFKQGFLIEESDGLKHFKCSECKRRLKLNKNADGYSILSNVNRHFKRRNAKE